MHVVVGATPIAGHVRPMMQVAEYLVAQDHDVTMVTAPEFAPLAAASGVRLRPLTPQLDGWLERRQGLTSPIDQLNLDFTELYARPVAAQHQVLQELLTPHSVLICDGGYTGAWPVLLGADGIRPALAIGVGVTAMAVTSDDTTPMTGPMPGDPEVARAAHRAANAELAAAIGPSQQNIERALRDAGARRPIALFFDAGYAVWDIAAQLCVPEFEYPRSDAPPALRFVGPLPVPSFDELTLPGWWSEVTAGDRDVVLVNQGTLANADPGDLIVPTIDALADRDVLVVVALGREPSSLARTDRALPANVRLGGFLPFDRLLPHVSVAVTNGGYGSTQQMLRHGIPLVVAGVEDDKPFVAARVATCGAGLDLRTGRPTPEQVRAAVDTARSDPRYRRSARAMADRIERTDALATLDGMVRQSSHLRQ